MGHGHEIWVMSCFQSPKYIQMEVSQVMGIPVVTVSILVVMVIHDDWMMTLGNSPMTKYGKLQLFASNGF